MAGDVRGERAVGVEQGLDGHHDLHLDVHVAGGGLSGQPFDEGVGEDLAAAAGDRVGGDVVLVDRPVQRTEAGGGLFGGQVRDEVGQPSAASRTRTCRPARAARALSCAFSGATSMARSRVQVVHPPHPEPLDLSTGQPLIHRRALGRVEVGGRRDDLQDRVLRQLAGGEQFPHVVEPEVQVPRQVQSPASVER